MVNSKMAGLQFTTLITSFLLSSLSTILVLMRLYCNVAVIKRAGVADAMILAAVIITWGITITNVFQVHFGAGAPFTQAEMNVAFLLGTLKSWYAYQILYQVDLLFIKLSILFFYRSISEHRWFRKTVHAAMAFVGAMSISFILTNAFQCPRPSDAFSMAVFIPGKCSDRETMWIVHASINIFTDLFIVLLPMPLLYRLQITRARRITLMAIFSVGILALISSILRLVNLVIWTRSDDQAESGGRILLFTDIELNGGIMCASFPAIKALFTTAMAKAKDRLSTLGSFNDSYGRSGKSNSKNSKISKMGLRRQSITPGNTVSLQTLKSAKSRTRRISQNLASSTRSRTDQDPNASNECLFIDEPGHCCVECCREEGGPHRHSSGIKRPSSVLLKQNAILKSMSVSQTTSEAASPSQQYYRQHFLR
ncbi:uncharacterized protein IWZ02DRAFT_206006 [Phyllosticta citriasiana]|uniref:Rhodopsin domain-containing protein n=1 Tax=Phyllosticta citriasiana TaxID=595635 RepID=A0ABR1KS11_9PEZI